MDSEAMQTSEGLAWTQDIWTQGLAENAQGRVPADSIIVLDHALNSIYQGIDWDPDTTNPQYTGTTFSTVNGHPLQQPTPPGYNPGQSNYAAQHHQELQQQLEHNLYEFSTTIQYPSINQFQYQPHPPRTFIEDWPWPMLPPLGQYNDFNLPGRSTGPSVNGEDQDEGELAYTFNWLEDIYATDISAFIFVPGLQRFVERHTMDIEQHITHMEHVEHVEPVEHVEQHAQRSGGRPKSQCGPCRNDPSKPCCTLKREAPGDPCERCAKKRRGCYKTIMDDNDEQETAREYMMGNGATRIVLLDADGNELDMAGPDLSEFDAMVAAAVGEDSTTDEETVAMPLDDMMDADSNITPAGWDFVLAVTK